MTKKYIGIVGSIFSETLKSLRKECSRQNLLLVWFKDKDDISINKDSFFDKLCYIDCSSEESIKASLCDLRADLVFLISIYERYIVPASVIGHYFGVKMTSISDSKVVTDKALMRERLKKHNKEITAAYKVIEDHKELDGFANRYAFPLMLKPAHLMKSLLVTKNNDLKELKKNFFITKKLLKETYFKQKMNSRVPKIIVEEFIKGSYHSVDGFIDNKGSPHFFPLVDLVMANEAGIDDNHNYMRSLPSVLSLNDRERALNVCKDAVKAIGLINSPTHIEIVKTKDGFKIIEVGARFGGYRERMHKLSYGIDTTKDTINIVLGNKPVERSKAKLLKHCSVIELFPGSKGRLVDLGQLKRAKDLKSTVYFSIKSDTGEVVGLAKDGYKAVAIVILASDSEKQINRDIKTIKSITPIKVS